MPRKSPSRIEREKAFDAAVHMFEVRLPAADEELEPEPCVRCNQSVRVDAGTYLYEVMDPHGAYAMVPCVLCDTCERAMYGKTTSVMMYNPELTRD